MIEKRCQNPHPDLPGKPCNFIARVKAQDGEVEVQCPRCHGWVRFDFRRSLTSSAA